MTPEWSVQSRQSLVNEAALLAVAQGEERGHHVGIPRRRSKRSWAGLEKKERLINPEERKIVPTKNWDMPWWLSLLPGTDPVQKISIIPRGIAALGYTMQVPTEIVF